MERYMVIEAEGLTFKKTPRSDMVNVYAGGENVDCYTNYNIKTDFEYFAATVTDYLLDRNEE